MAKRSIDERLEVLEQKVEMLETLPERVHAVELQIVQLRAEMRDGFSALRGELAARTSGLATREELTACTRGLATREELAACTRGLATREELAARTSGLATRGELQALEATLREEIRAGDEETRRYMRVLHEDVKSDIGLIAEHLARVMTRLEAL